MGSEAALAAPTHSQKKEQGIWKLHVHGKCLLVSREAETKATEEHPSLRADD